MYPVSTAYQTKIKENNRVFRMQIEIQHSQGQLILGDKDLVGGSFTYTESSQAGEDFTVGSVVASHIEFKVLNKAEYADIDWEGATVIPTVGLLLSSEQYFLSPTYPAETELWEYVPLGRFNIDDVVRLRNTIDIKAIDNMIELDKPYSLSQLSYPATLYQIYVDICNVADIAVGTASFPNSDYLVATRPDGSLTLRDVLSYVAALAGRFARCSRTGALELAWYEPSGLTLGPSNRFEFRPKDYTVQIKGVMATVDDVTYLSGTDDYAIDLTGNPLLQSDYEAVLSTIYTAVKDVVFTPYDSRWQGDPAIQAGDMITQVDRDGNEYETLVTSSTYKYRGASILSANGLPIKAKGYKGSTNKKLVEIKRRIDKEVGDKLTTLEQAQLNATELIANMLGGHAIPTADAFYIADNPDLEQATKVWKWGIGGFGYSENGVEGPYNTAVTADGSIVAMLVAANIITANMVQVTPQKTVADELNSKLTEGQNYAGVTIDANTGITITDSEGTSTVLDSNGMLDAYQINIADNLDATHPLVMRVYVPEGVSRVDTMELTAYADKFRAYQTGAHENGMTIYTARGDEKYTIVYGNETEIVQGVTIPTVEAPFGWHKNDVYLNITNPSDYTMSLTIGMIVDGGPQAIWPNITLYAKETRRFSIFGATATPPANGSVASWDADWGGKTIYGVVTNHGSVAAVLTSLTWNVQTSHTHAPVYSIYEDTVPASVGLKIDGVDRTTALGGPWSGSGGAFALPSLDLVPYITTPGWHTIEFTSTTLGRITAALTCQQFIRHSGV